LAELYTTRTGVWTSIAQVNGVSGLCDLRVISLGTLCAMLAREPDFLDLVESNARQKSPYDVIRAYWAKVRQPRLDLSEHA
jgi:hypothetical protein